MSGPVQNTDREIWRGPSPVEHGDPDRYYADSIHVTEGGGIGFNCGGHVIVKPAREWFAAMLDKMAEGPPRSLEPVHDGPQKPWRLPFKPELRIVLSVIPHDLQRYETVGDWWVADDGSWQIRVSRMGNWRYEMLVAVHELVEMVACQHAGVSVAEIDAFDKAFEANRKTGNTDEPGDDLLAPYNDQHCLATGIERVLAAALGVPWATYDEAVNAL